jgi:hypothetical protein
MPRSIKKGPFIDHHLIVDQNRHMLTPVVYRNGQTNHVRQDHGAA